MTDHAPPLRRGNPGLVLLAVVFLAIIGASVGVIAGIAANRSGTSSTGGPGGGRPGGSGQSASPGTGATTSPTPGTGSRELCLSHTADLARDKGSRGDLVVYAYYVTRFSEVWICRDSAGTLYYQGHSGGPSDRDLVEGVDALFLTDVQREGAGYVATNRNDTGRTEYHMSRSTLSIRRYPSNVVEDQDVLAFHGDGA